MDILATMTPVEYSFVKSRLQAAGLWERTDPAGESACNILAEVQLRELRESRIK